MEETSILPLGWVLQQCSYWKEWWLQNTAPVIKDFKKNKIVRHHCMSLFYQCLIGHLSVWAPQKDWAQGYHVPSSLLLLDMDMQLLNSEMPQTFQPKAKGNARIGGKKRTEKQKEEEEEENNHNYFWNGGNSRKKSIAGQSSNWETSTHWGRQKYMDTSN